MHGCSLDCIRWLQLDQRLQVRRAREVQLFSDIVELPAPLPPAAESTEYGPLPYPEP
jgi:hypothetical protein